MWLKYSYIIPSYNSKDASPIITPCGYYNGSRLILCIFCGTEMKHYIHSYAVADYEITGSKVRDFTMMNDTTKDRLQLVHKPHDLAVYTCIVTLICD